MFCTGLGGGVALGWWGLSGEPEGLGAAASAG